MKPLKINPEYLALVPRPSKEEYDALEKDIIEKQGATEPIIINERDEILDGHTRFDICNKYVLYFDTVVRKFPSVNEEKKYIIETNLLRRNLSPLAKIQLIRKLEDIESTLSADREKAGVKIEIPSGNISLGSKGETRNIMGKKVGMSGKTYDKGIKILDEGTPEEVQKGLRGEEKIESLYNQILRRQNINQVKDTIPLPQGKYRCIVIDPPWHTEKIIREARPLQGPILEYPTMSIEQIEALPIEKLAYEDGCHIYLWITHKYLPAGIKLFEVWGVNYQCIMTWVKPTGMTPYSWMYNTEHVLFGRIGNLQLTKLGIKLSFEESSREHSRKPNIFYNIVKEASPEPRIDLFSREKREGFDQWGNEVNKFE